jgi:hypothetical protein
MTLRSGPGINFRNQFNHVVLECRSRKNCQHFRIIGALGFPNAHVYVSTSDWLITRTRQTPIQPVSFGIAGASGAGEERPRAGKAANGSATAPPPADGESSSGAVAASEPDTAAAIRSQHEVGAPGGLPANGTALANATSHCCEAAVASAGDPDGASRSQELSLFHASSPEGANYRDQQAHGKSVDVLVSSISVTLERGNKLERQSSVQVLSRLTSGARLFRGRWPVLCPGSGRRTTGDLWAGVGGFSRLAD